MPTPSVDATSTGSSIAAIALAENTPPKLPTPCTTSAPWVRSTATRIWSTAWVPASMSTPAAAYERQRRARGPPADVPAHLHPVELDPGHRLVRRGAGGGEIRPEAGDREHPPAGRHAVGHPGREHECSRFFGVRGSLSDPRCRQNRFSDHRGVGVAGGGGDDGAGGAVGDVEGDVGEAALGRGEGEGGEVRAEQRQDRLGLRVAEADVVLDEAGAVGGEHQPGVEHADVRRAGAGEVVEDRLDERRHQLVGRVRNRRRGVGAHPAGVRPGVALADALVVLGQGQRPGDPAVAQGEQRALRAVHPLLEDERPGGGPDRGERLARRFRDRDPLARGEPVQLDDDGAAELVGPLDRGVMVARLEAGEAWSRDAERIGQLAGEPLGRLQPGQRRGRAEARDALLRAAVGDAGHERRLRPRDDEVGPLVVGVRDVGDQTHVVAVPPARPGDRVLPPARADDDDAHD